MSATYRNIEVEIIEDPQGDSSYLDQTEFADRKEAFLRGDFYFIGIRAKCEVLIPMGGNVFTTFTLASPGLWGIEDDSSDEYLEKVASDEKQTLLMMLGKLGAKEQASERSET